jgi:plasmid maintenance system antidote protein VapI
MSFWKDWGIKMSHANSKRPDNATIIEAIHAENGNISQVAKHLAVARKSIYELLKSDKELRDELAHAREYMFDLADDVLMKHLEEGSLKAATFVHNHMTRTRNLQPKPKPKNTQMYLFPQTQPVPPVDADASVPKWVEPDTEQNEIKDNLTQ